MGHFASDVHVEIKNVRSVIEALTFGVNLIEFFNSSLRWSGEFKHGRSLAALCTWSRLPCERKHLHEVVYRQVPFAQNCFEGRP